MQSLSPLIFEYQMIKKPILNPESYENHTNYNFPLTQNENEATRFSFEPIQVGLSCCHSANETNEGPQEGAEAAVSSTLLLMWPVVTLIRS